MGMQKLKSQMNNTIKSKKNMTKNQNKNAKQMEAGVMNVVIFS